MRSLFTLVLLLSLSAFAKEQIPLQDFFKNPTAAYFQLSPDGTKLAYLKAWEGRMNIFVRPVDKPQEEKQLTAVRDRDISDFFWKGNANLFYSKDFGGDENFHLFRVNVATGEEKDMTPFEKTRVSLVDDLANVSENEILISHNRRNPEVFDVYRLSLKDNSAKIVYKNPGDVGDYTTDQKGRLRIAIKNSGANTEVLYRDSDSGKFVNVLTYDYNHSFYPVQFAPSGKTFYAISNIGRDKEALVEFDPKTKKEVRIIYQDPSYDVDAVGFSPIIYSKKRDKLLGVNFTTWKIQQAFFDPETEQLYKLIQDIAPDSFTIQFSQNKAEDKFVFFAAGDRSRGTFYLVDAKTKKVDILAEAAPWLKKENLATMKPVQFMSRDGLTVHGYLTVPPGKDAKNLPVVINPHGGPWARDVWRFNSEAQFLANRGYAVMQVNFRGSTGYGKNFMKASFKQWGLAMQDDVTDATKWLIDQGIANPKKICIYGGSYGGYATLMGVVKEPNLYACGVDYVGVSNLFTFMKTIPPYWAPLMGKFHAWVGNPETDKDQFTQTSPALNVEKIKTPLFIAQGAKDPRVNKDESDQMVKNLKARGIDVPYLVKENEGHGFRNEENRFEFYTQMESFLAKHLQ